MKNIYIPECQFCGGMEFVEGYQDAYAAVTGESAWSGCRLKHTFCRQCGSVVRSYVDNPEKLLKKANRR